jgi:hypothetical protein
MTTERRGSPRVEIVLAVRLTRRQGTAVEVRTLDLGPGGARIESSRPLRIDEELGFDFDLPDGARHLNCRARVLRQQRTDVYALRFEHLSALDTETLRALAAA